MTTQDKEAVEAAKDEMIDGLHCCLTGDCPHSRLDDCLQYLFLAGVEWQKQREKPVNGELEGG